MWQVLVEALCAESADRHKEDEWVSNTCIYQGNWSIVLKFFLFLITDMQEDSPGHQHGDYTTWILQRYNNRICKTVNMISTFDHEICTFIWNFISINYINVYIVCNRKRVIILYKDFCRFFVLGHLKSCWI